MTLGQVSLFFAFLTVAANVGVAGVAIATLGRRVSPVLAGFDRRLRDGLAHQALPLAFLVAVVATLGSLYLSEIAHLVPCRLCWFQRIAMYPLAVVFAVAWWRRDEGAWWYGVPIAIGGAGVAAYHYLVQWVPGLESSACTASVPCSGVYFRRFGFMSIPYMALSGFLAIVALGLYTRLAPRTEPPTSTVGVEHHGNDEDLEGRPQAGRQDDTADAIG